MTEVDPFAWWRAALADPSKIGKELTISEGYPEQGYYRAKEQGGSVLLPVAIWKEGDEWYARQGGKDVDPQRIWLWAAEKPVSYEGYLNAVIGEPWPDEDETVASTVREVTKEDNTKEVSEDEQWRSQVDAALAGRSKYKVINSDDEAKKATGLKNRIVELKGEGKKKHESEKKPHLEAGKTIDKKWLPKVKEAEDGAKEIISAIDEWETKKLHAARAAQKKLDDEAAAKRKAEEEAQAKLPVEERAPVADVAPVVASVAPTQVRPTYGRAASVRAVIVIDEVQDWPKLATYYSARIAVQDLLRKLAQEDISAGNPPPGLTTKEVAKSR